jgi:hypothetical protein
MHPLIEPKIRINDAGVIVRPSKKNLIRPLSASDGARIIPMFFRFVGKACFFSAVSALSVVLPPVKNAYGWIDQAPPVKFDHLDTAICDISGKPVIMNYNEHSFFVKPVSMFNATYLDGSSFVGKTTAMKTWVKMLQKDGEYAVYVSLKDCKDGRYNEHLRNSILGPLHEHSTALKFHLTARLGRLLGARFVRRKPITIVIDDAHLVANPMEVLLDQDGNWLGLQVNTEQLIFLFSVVFVTGKDVITSECRQHFVAEKRSLVEQHCDRERILHTLKRRMNIDEPHLDQIVSAVGVSLKDIDAVMHNVKQLMPAGSPVSARPTTEMVSSAIDDVLKTRYQELRSVADQLTDDSRTGTGTGTDAGTDAGTIN